MPKFKSESLGKWFYFNDDEAQGGVQLRELTTDEHRRIEKLTVKHKMKFERGTGRRYDDATTDEKLVDKLRWDFCIVDWKEVYLDGQELACTAENKVKMMKVTDFVKVLVDWFEELAETNESLRSSQAKNLESSSNGSAE